MAEFTGIGVDEPGLLILDTRLTPMLRFIVFDEKGEPKAMDPFVIAAAVLDPGNMSLGVRHAVPGSFSAIWRKQAGAATAQQPPAPLEQPPIQQPPAQQAPPAAPQAQPAAPARQLDLSGAWLVSDGWSQGLEFAGNQFAYYENGEVTDYGTYQVRGATIVIQSAAYGNTEVYNFQTDGRTLQVSGNGLNLTLYRETE